MLIASPSGSSGTATRRLVGAALLGLVGAAGLASGADLASGRAAGGARWLVLRLVGGGAAGLEALAGGGGGWRWLVWARFDGGGAGRWRAAAEGAGEVGEAEIADGVAPAEVRGGVDDLAEGGLGIEVRGEHLKHGALALGMR
jgi:hypothetical protein